MNTRCGYVAIIGRPNVGKSTLLNTLLRQKVSITSKKPQTTRQNVLGIRTSDDCQMLFVDTPGLHLKEHRAINRYMNRSARKALRDVDIVLFLIDRDRWNEEDDYVAGLFDGLIGQKILVINKIDLIRDKASIISLLQIMQDRFPDAEIVPVSAEKNRNMDALLGVIRDQLPVSPFYYETSQVTDRSERFLVSEIIREKIMRQMGEEIPHAVTIQIDRFQEEKNLTLIEATIFVERDGQKKILIGSGGERLKRIGSDARVEIQKLLERRIVLKTWVKIKTGWSDDERAIKSLGYDEH